MRNVVTIALMGVAVSVLAAALACIVPAPSAEPSFTPVPTLEATPERPPSSAPSSLRTVDRSAHTLTIVWKSSYRATSYDVQRSASEDGDYAVVASDTTVLGIVDEGLQPDSLYYYRVRACNHLGCSEFSRNAVAGVTESDGKVSVPSAPAEIHVVKKTVEIFPDVDEVTWTEVQGATYYRVYRAGEPLNNVSAPLTQSRHTDLGRSIKLSIGSYYQVRACNKAGCSDFT